MQSRRIVASTPSRRTPEFVAVAWQSDRASSAALIDFAVPGLNGGRTAAALRAVRPGLPVVLMSGYGDLEALAEAWSGPILRKPFNLTDLARELASATASA